MKIRVEILGIITAICVIELALPSRAVAEVTDEAFNELKTMVEQLSQKVEGLEQTHAEDQKRHAEDQEKIRGLQAQIGETKKSASNADQKAVADDKASPPVAEAPTVAPAGALATHDFMVAGDAEVQYSQVHGQHGGFQLADFAPIFLFRASENVLFEAGFDFIIQNNAPSSGGYTTTVNLSFATLDYLYNDYLTVVAGNMLLPLGTYSERSAGWLNKIPDNPLPRALLPGTGVGLQLRGAIPVGHSGASFTYSAYGVNGPGSVDGSGNADQLDLGGNVGLKSDGTTGNLHSNPSGGGRLAVFVPFKAHYDVELGVSGQGGEWDNAGNRSWSGLVADGAVHVSPYFEVKGEYINTWYGTDNMGTIHPHGGWIQAGYKLAGLNSEVELPLIKISNIELVGRYDTANDGMKHGLGTHTNRETVGFVYYLTNTLWLEGDYEWLQSEGPNELPPRDFVFQLSFGF